MFNVLVLGFNSLYSIPRKLFGNLLPCSFLNVSHLPFSLHFFPLPFLPHLGALLTVRILPVLYLTVRSYMEQGMHKMC